MEAESCTADTHLGGEEVPTGDGFSQLVAPGPPLQQHAAGLSDQEGDDEHDAARRLRNTGHKITPLRARGSLGAL